jgi:hypothetical protein
LGKSPGTYPKESKLHLKHGENLKSRENLPFKEEAQTALFNPLAPEFSFKF